MKTVDKKVSQISARPQQTVVVKEGRFATLANLRYMLPTGGIGTRQDYIAALRG